MELIVTSINTAVITLIDTTVVAPIDTTVVAQTNSESLLESFGAYLEANPNMIVILSFWEALWTLLGVWFAARNNQKVWFFAMGVLQIFGLVEIIYLATQTSFFKNFNLND